VGVPTPLPLDWYNFISTRAFLSLANFKLYRLSVIQRGITATTLNFRMMNEKVFATILWSNKAKTLVCVEPLNCTLTHTIFSVVDELLLMM